MYCTKCGKEIDEKAMFCTNCGNQTNNITKDNKRIKKDQTVIVRWILFSFLVLVGLGGLSFNYGGFIILLGAIIVIPLLDNILNRIKLINSIKIIIAIIFFFIGMYISGTSPEYMEYENNKILENNIKANELIVQEQIAAEEKAIQEQKEAEEKAIKVQKEAEEKAAQEKREAEERVKAEQEHKKYIEEQKIVGLNNFKEIRKAYKTNELSANDKYKGNTYTLYGQISAIKEDGFMNAFLDKIGVTITYRDNNSIVYTFCDFNSSERDKLTKYNTGDYILFSGTCSSYGNWYNCKVIQ